MLTYNFKDTTNSFTIILLNEQFKCIDINCIKYDTDNNSLFIINNSYKIYDLIKDISLQQYNIICSQLNTISDSIIIDLRIKK